jgi:hypothetical protein
VLCAAGYNIRWLLRMIAKKGVTFLAALLLRLCPVPTLALNWARICATSPSTGSDSQRSDWAPAEMNISGPTTNGALPQRGQTAPGWPPAPVSVATSLCEPHRAFIEAQLRLKRNATAIYRMRPANPS